MKKKKVYIAFLVIFIFFPLVLAHSAAAKDLYKILGVEKNASQRDVQKAFHRLSLKYHPDKNPSKSAQAKFAEINNAYEVLSDEEKRKNYDLFGDEQGRARGPDPNSYNDGFHQTDGGGGAGGGWQNFRYTTHDNSGHRFEQHSYGFGGEEGSYGQGNTFNFPFDDFDGQEKSSFFGFSGNANPFYNIFDSFFGTAKGKGGQGQRFTSYNEGKTKSSKERKSFQGGAQPSSSIEELNVKSFQKKVLDQLDTWAILFVPHTSEEAQQKLQFLEQTSRSLGGSIKVGYVNCEGKKQFCEQQNMWPLKTLKLRLYSLRRNGKLSALDYTGEWSATDVKSYFIDVLPKLSKHLEDVGFLSDELMQMEDNSPAVVLFTKKKDTPAIWRALSGMFYGRIAFFDVQVHDDVDAIPKKFKVDSFPAIVGIYANGETKVLSSGASLEQVSSSIKEVNALLEDFERKSKAAGPKKGKTDADGGIPSLTKKNFESVCSQDTPLCVIGVHKSSKGRDKLRQILKEISQKSLVRKGRSISSSKNPVSYSVLDAMKQSPFLNAFDKSILESENLVLIAYKPKKGTYTSYDGPMNLENAENFVVEVLGGELQLRRVVQDPVLI